MKKPEDIQILIPAAGSGQRAGASVPKQYLEIAGKTLLRHTIEKMRRAIPDSPITIIIDAKMEQVAQNALKSIKNIHFCIGGESRKESIFNGLKSIANVKRDDTILIHDAARPFVDTKDITKLLKTLESHKAATLCAPTPNTICGKTPENKITSYKDRASLVNILTPQAFTFDTIMQAHEKFKNENDFTDDTSLVHKMGIEVALIQSNPHNFKITTPEDLILAETILRKNTQPRTGSGFDVHAFDMDTPTDIIRLGGIDIPFDKKLKGHSDADVILHTVTDALLGAIGAGDIGDHFPPSDSQWKGKDSAFFLEHTRNLITQRGGTIINVDVTAICEMPKLAPYKQAIKERIAQILNTPASTINVKATTTEKLGFTGRGEGIACQASATVEMPKD